MKKIVYALMLLLTVGLGLQGCIVLAAAGAGAATSAVVVNDRRPVQTITDDQNIEYTAHSEINQTPPFLSCLITMLFY
jgi:osmotically-inducible protein OsmY